MPRSKQGGKVKKAKSKSKAKDRAQTVDMLPVFCPNPKCHSTKREHFDGRAITRDFENVLIEPKLGIKFNRIIYRKTVCLDCGQRMVVRQFMMRPVKG